VALASTPNILAFARRKIGARFGGQLLTSKRV
jgi:hypothetical protein